MYTIRHLCHPLILIFTSTFFFSLYIAAFPSEAEISKWKCYDVVTRLERSCSLKRWSIMHGRRWKKVSKKPFTVSLSQPRGIGFNEHSRLIWIAATLTHTWSRKIGRVYVGRKETRETRGRKYWQNRGLARYSCRESLVRVCNHFPENKAERIHNPLICSRFFARVPALALSQIHRRCRSARGARVQAALKY